MEENILVENFTQPVVISLCAKVAVMGLGCWVVRLEKWTYRYHILTVNL